MTDLSSIMQKLWEIESIPKAEQWTLAEQRAEQIFVESHERGPDGRYVVKIPLVQDPPPLGKSRTAAVACFHGLERRFSRQPDLYAKYRAVIDDYKAEGHLVAVKTLASEDGNSYVIPHHPINFAQNKHKQKGKFRVVFNASAKTTTGISFNDQQLTGPKIQSELIDNFLRFRTYRFVLSADVVQMFRQVGVSPTQWDLQRIIWRNTPSQPLQEFAITVVTWRMRSAGFNSVRALRQCAIDGRDKFPVGSIVALNDFYYDDMHTGADSEDDLFVRYDEVNKLLRTGGFTLSKWATNSERLATRIKIEEQEGTTFTSEAGVLGMCWQAEFDGLSIKVTAVDEPTPGEQLTKRILLSRIAKIFDPSGLIAPVIITGKMRLFKPYGSLMLDGMNWCRRNCHTNGLIIGIMLLPYQISEFQDR